MGSYLGKILLVEGLESKTQARSGSLLPTDTFCLPGILPKRQGQISRSDGRFCKLILEQAPAQLNPLETPATLSATYRFCKWLKGNDQFRVFNSLDHYAVVRLLTGLTMPVKLRI